MRRSEGVRVFLRIRPDDAAQYGTDGNPRFAGRDASRSSSLVSGSMSSDSTVGYHVEHTFEHSLIQLHVSRRGAEDVVNNAKEDFTFEFRRVFEPHASQEDVFSLVAESAVRSALDGYNSTVFAYGQTGSGKTYSITGGTESFSDRGIIPRALSLVYAEIDRRRQEAPAQDGATGPLVWTVMISYLQIYNDRGQDLLNGGRDARRLEDLPAVTVYEGEEDVLLKGLEQHYAGSVADALNLLFLGDTNRLYCETPMNKTSSRSHTVFTIQLEAREHGSASVRRSRLNLVDLAGSERAAKSGLGGTSLSEAKYINLSLHYLEQVIVALGELTKGQRDHIPYRNSFMTMVLRDSLDGNCLTSMLATAHANRAFLPETISTCKFAQRVALIKQTARVNIDTDPRVLVRKLKAEVAQLRDQLAFFTQRADGANLAGDRVLSADEHQRCRDLVVRYLQQSDPGARLEGFEGDLARIYACFAIMKGMLQQQPQPQPQLTGDAAQMPLEDGRRSGGAEEALRRRVSELEASLQQKEAEISTLFAVLEQRPGPGGPVASSAPPPAPVRVDAVSQSRSFAHLSKAEVVAAQEFFSHKADAEPSAPLSSSPPAGDAELLKDRAKAFEAFRASCTEYAHIDAKKADLKERYARCKQAAEELNATVEAMRRFKGLIQQLRTERILQGLEATVDAEEHMLLRALDEKKERYNQLTKVLATEKEYIDHTHFLLKRSQEQLARDFECWFEQRQRSLEQPKLPPEPQRNQFAPQYASTGDPVADERLAALYQLRDSLHTAAPPPH